MLPHPLTIFKIQKYYQNELNFNGVYSRNNFFKVKSQAYIINLDEYGLILTHLIALYANDNNVFYFVSSGVENIGNKNIKINIYRIKAYDSIMPWCFCIGFFDFMLKAKSLSDYINGYEMILLMIMK